MSTEELLQAIEDFAKRIEFLQNDFSRLQEDFLAYEDEAACGYCSKRGALETRDCEHCSATFCKECWEKALTCAAGRKKATP